MRLKFLTSKGRPRDAELQGIISHAQVDNHKDSSARKSRVNSSKCYYVCD